MLVPSFLASFIRPGDELRIPDNEAAAGGAIEIYIHVPDSEKTRTDLFLTEIGYVTHPHKDRNNNWYVAAEVHGRSLGISSVYIRCDLLRDYFYAAKRNCNWERQAALYDLLRVDSRVSPKDLRLAFRLRDLELRASGAPLHDLRALERAFNILARPEGRESYDKLLVDPQTPVPFPCGGFGSLLVSGALSRDGPLFYAARVLSFRPQLSTKTIRVPLRGCKFFEQSLLYRDSHRKLEVSLDHVVAGFSWDTNWNRWKHLVGAKVQVKAAFLRTGQYRHQEEEWKLRTWETALPSRIEVTTPDGGLALQVARARKTYLRFGQFSKPLEEIRLRLESVPMEREDLRRLCSTLGVPGDFDVCLITWKPDYDDFYYKELQQRARRVYFYRCEYIFDLERFVVAETPQLGHATYLFAKPDAIIDFLAIYRMASRGDILRNRNNVAERLGFLCRLVHSRSHSCWVKDLRQRLGEPPANDVVS